MSATADAIAELAENKVPVTDLEVFAEDLDPQKAAEIYKQHGCLVVRGLMKPYLTDLQRDIEATAQQSIGLLDQAKQIPEGWTTPDGHALALMAGMQAAAVALLRQFDPQSLTQRLDKTSLLRSLVPGARKARYWETYEQQYRQIAGEVSESVRGIFGRAFAQAYEEQIKKL